MAETYYFLNLFTTYFTKVDGPEVFGIRHNICGVRVNNAPKSRTVVYPTRTRNRVYSQCYTILFTHWRLYINNHFKWLTRSPKRLKMNCNYNHKYHFLSFFLPMVLLLTVFKSLWQSNFNINKNTISSSVKFTDKRIP